jgi:hypothetical protein
MKLPDLQDLKKHYRDDGRQMITCEDNDVLNAMAVLQRLQRTIEWQKKKSVEVTAIIRRFGGAEEGHNEILEKLLEGGYVKKIKRTPPRYQPTEAASPYLAVELPEVWKPKPREREDGIPIDIFLKALGIHPLVNYYRKQEELKAQQAANRAIDSSGSHC